MDTNSLMSLTKAKYIYEEIVDSGKWFDTSIFVKEEEKNHYLLGKKVVGLMKDKEIAKFAATVFKSYSHETQKVDGELQSSEFIRAKGEKIMYLES